MTTRLGMPEKSARFCAPWNRNRENIRVPFSGVRYCQRERAHTRHAGGRSEASLGKDRHAMEIRASQVRIGMAPNVNPWG
jgi:hypothetical protein